MSRFGCGKCNERHQPTDIALDDLKAAASGRDMGVAQAADNILMGAHAQDQSKAP